MIELIAFCEVLFEVVHFVDGVVHFIDDCFAMAFDSNYVVLDDDASKDESYDFDDWVMIVSFMIMT